MRNYGQNIPIASEAVRKFYDQRFSPERPLGSVMLSDDEEMLRRRDENEREQVMSLFQLDPQKTQLLDLGCGNGRWYEPFKDHVRSYEGVDFSAPNIEFALTHRRGGAESNFVIGNCTQIGQMPLKYSPYNFVLSCGLFVYLNDDEVLAVLRSLLHLLQPSAQIYIRVSVSVMGQRLTLKDFPSETLKADYHGIYRPPEEYEEIFRTLLVSAGFRLTHTSMLLRADIGARKETNQQYWFFERKQA